MNKAEKDPDSTLDFGFDWEDWLDTDTISTSTWTLPSGITEVTNSKTDTTTTIWISGGTAGNTYLVTNRIVTAASRTEDRSFMLLVKGG